MTDTQDVLREAEPIVTQVLRLLSEGINYFGKEVVVGIIVLVILGYFGAFRNWRRKRNGS